MRRVVQPELLDSDAGPAEEVRAALADLRMVNGYFGGLSTSAALIARVARQSGTGELSLLDVASAFGDGALHAARELRREVKIQVTLLDRAVAHLPRGGNRALVGDALRLPFACNSFDIVSCALFAHHLEPEQVIEFVDEALRVARRAVIINDLRRSALHLALVYAGRPLFRSRMAWSDGLVSVRRAYTIGEMRQMLGRTRAARIEVAPSYLWRMGVIAWK